MRDLDSKIMTLAQAAAWRREQRQRGVAVAVTNGCFDILHRGHVHYLERARALAGALVVGVNGDESVRRLKGPGRPLNSAEDRLAVLAALEAVDAVVCFEEEDALALLRALEPDVYVKGGDYTLNTVNQEERRLLEALGSCIRFVPAVAGRSTSGLVRRIAGDAARNGG
jgi:rfaE bifunctional protein nucleotidyltransferase chain/domain